MGSPNTIGLHPMMNYSLAELTKRVCHHKARLELMVERGMSPILAEREQEIIDVLEQILVYRVKFLYRCMGIKL